MSQVLRRDGIEVGIREVFGTWVLPRRKGRSNSDDATFVSKAWGDAPGRIPAEIRNGISTEAACGPVTSPSPDGSARPVEPLTSSPRILPSLVHDMEVRPLTGIEAQSIVASIRILSFMKAKSASGDLVTKPEGMKSV